MDAGHLEWFPVNGGCTLYIEYVIMLVMVAKMCCAVIIKPRVASRFDNEKNCLESRRRKLVNCLNSYL